MVIFYYICGGLCFFGALITALNSFVDGSQIFIMIPTIAAGLLFFQVASLTDRVSVLEDKLSSGNDKKPAKPFSDDSVPQVRCMKCGKTFDFDFEKCPFCGSDKISKQIHTPNFGPDEDDDD